MITLSNRENTLHVTIVGEFDFNVARKLVHACRVQLHENDITRIEISLEQVTYCNSCAFGAILLLAEWARDDLHIHLHDCHADVHSLFNSGFMNRHFNGLCPPNGNPPPSSSCAKCLDGACRQDPSGPKPGCPMKAQFAPLFPKPEQA